MPGSGTLDNPLTWGPNESAALVWFERGWLNGVFLGAVAYGAHATLFFSALSLLLPRARQNAGWLLYIVALFAVSSVGNALQLRIANMGFIDYREYPGPPGGWEAGNGVAIAGNAVYILNLWLQDGLLLYRFRVIVGGRYVLLALPALVFAATIGVGCTLIYMLTHTRAVLWAKLSADLLTAYFSVSVAYNLVLTLAIVGKLLLTRSRNSATSKHHTSLAAMFVESACLYSIVGVVLLVATGLKDAGLQNLVLPTLSQVQSIAPMLIILRIAQGRAWSEHTEASLSTTPPAARESLAYAPKLEKSSTEYTEKSLEA